MILCSMGSGLVLRLDVLGTWFAEASKVHFKSIWTNNPIIVVEGQSSIDFVVNTTKGMASSVK
jgi:hypothetical protein